MGNNEVIRVKEKLMNKVHRAFQYTCSIPIYFLIIYGTAFSGMLFDPNVRKFLLRDVFQKEKIAGLLEGSIIQNPLYVPNIEEKTLSKEVGETTYTDEITSQFPAGLVRLAIGREHDAETVIRTLQRGLEHAYQK